MKLKHLFLAFCFLLIAVSDACGLEKNIELLTNQLHVVEVDQLRRVAVGDPKVADITVISEKQVMVVAKDQGSTSLIIWDKLGERKFNITINDVDPEIQAQSIRELLVAADLHGLRVKVEGEKMFVVGEVLTEKQVQKVKDLIQPFKDFTTSLVTVDEEQPLIEVEVKVLEISIEDLKQLGMDWTQNLPVIYTEPAFIEGKAPKLWRMFDWDRTQVDARLNMLIQEDKARTLANPKLIALSGKKAEFLVGGDVPYVVEQDDQKTTVEWREYGVNLKVEPQVNEKNEIMLKILAEVSDLDWGNAVTHADFNIPAIKKRKVESELLLRENELAFFAGLIKNEDSRNVDRLPWLSKVPILGELFKSTDFRDKRTEMVITLAPRILGARVSPGEIAAQMREQEALLAAQRTFSAYSEEESPLTYYSHMIEDIIARNVKYPDQARQGRQEGIVKVNLSLKSDGKLKEVVVRESSGYDILDQTALAAVRAQAPYPAFPQQLSQEELSLTIPVVFKSYE
ncbi:TonB family protein [Candidatus Omnitrophota bacterium]